MMGTAILSLVGVWAVCGAEPAAPAIHLHPPAGSAPAHITLEGLPAAVLDRLRTADLSPAAWAELLAVRVAADTPEETAARPPVLGTYRVTDEGVRFEPRFPFEPGVPYAVRFDPGKLPGSPGGRPVARTVSLPKPDKGPTALVEQVYPSGDRLPENLLRLYIHFSEPMRQGESYRHVRLTGPDGKDVHAPFLTLGEELWDAEGKRFTLLIDPGRIKSGLLPREEFGPVLEAGKRYTLTIDRTWRDAEGFPMKESFVKRFTATEPFDDAHDPKKWRITPPAAGSRGELLVRFPRPLDHALLHRFVRVIGPGGGPVAGAVAVSDAETAWHFLPQRPWAAGEYRLRIDTRLEDVAGNRIDMPFEVDVFRKVERAITTRTVERPFAVR
ncbi:MAG TPA: hypothetical protein VIL46_15630 [Gemmataceae bacterium]